MSFTTDVFMAAIEADPDAIRKLRGVATCLEKGMRSNAKIIFDSVMGDGRRNLMESLAEEEMSDDMRKEAYDLMVMDLGTTRRMLLNDTAKGFNEFVDNLENSLQ